MELFICPPDHKHAATLTCYASHHCRCIECRVAHGAHQRDVYRRKAYGTFAPRYIPSVGTRRRIEALACMGWSIRALAPLLGMDFRNLRDTLSRPNTARHVAARVARLYDELWDQRREVHSGSAVEQTLIRAQRLGFAPPLAWDDDTIDDPDAVPVVDPGIDRDRFDEAVVDAVLAGEHAQMSRRERDEVVRMLTARGWPAWRIAERSSCSQKTVDRTRARLHLPIPDHSIREAA